MDISLYSPLSPLFKVSITHLYYILTGLYLELLFTLKIKCPQAHCIKYTFYFFIQQREHWEQVLNALGTPISLFGKSCLSAYHYISYRNPYTLEYSYQNSIARGAMDFSDYSKVKYCQLLKLKPCSQFSNSGSKGNTGWWLENHCVSCKPQTCWDLSAFVFPKF